MSSPVAAPADPVPFGPSPASFAIPGELDASIALARALAGGERLALLLGGSHASGEAVWAQSGGRRVALSDVDLYAVLPDARSCREAARRAAAAGGRPAGSDPAAPLEIGFLTPAGLAALPARPGTIELRRHGRPIEGAIDMLERIPRWEGRDVSAEEIALLIENRAYELLWGGILLDSAAPLERLAGRHAVLKTGLDLAAVRCLAAGEYPDGAAARVARARALGVSGPEPPWDEALAFRHAPVPAADPRGEWLRVAEAWEAAWREHAARRGGDGFAAARHAAARAPWRRRLRQALGFRPRAVGVAPPALRGRLRHAAAGTPVHRLHASAAVLVLLRRRALEAGGAPAPADLAAARDAIARLGVLDPALGGEAAARAALALWDGWVLDGRRFGPRP